MKQNLVFLFKAMSLYGILAAAFSLIGIFLPEKQALASPLSALTIEHVGGHILWGLVAGAASLSLRYFLLTGSFAIILDSDHLIDFIGLDAISRMGHSIPFAVLSSVVMILLLGRKDYVLASAAFAGVLAHISFDIFQASSSSFPIFTPFYSEDIWFRNADWFLFQIAAIIIVGTMTILTKWKMHEKSQYASG